MKPNKITYLLMSSEQTSFVALIVAIKTTVEKSELRSITISNARGTKSGKGGVLSRFLKQFFSANILKY